jgi:hypothetical protein
MDSVYQVVRRLSDSVSDLDHDFHAREYRLSHSLAWRPYPNPHLYLLELVRHFAFVFRRGQLGGVSGRFGYHVKPVGRLAG